MLALFLIPALLGIALLVNLSEDDDETENETPAPRVVEDGYIGTDAAENLISPEPGGFINAAGGADTITGSNNDDGLLGGAGDDLIYANGGNDVVSGDAGDDRVFLGDGDDDYTPDDTYANLAGDDLVRGGDGRDLISDLLGSNNLFGDLGADTLVAFDGLGSDGNYDLPGEIGTTDTLSGGFGNDILAGDAGDVMTGGAGDDRFFVVDDEDEPDRDEVVITDFNTDDDALVVLQLDGLRSTGPLSLDFDETLNAVRVSYEGRGVAVLEGLTATDIPDIQISIAGLDALDRPIV